MKTEEFELSAQMDRDEELRLWSIGENKKLIVAVEKELADLRNEMREYGYKLWDFYLYNGRSFQW